jgi:type II secretory pathway pseudopilin PulG
MVRFRHCTERGFTLVGMIIVFTVMTVLLSAAMPLWSKMIQRDREEELIFRGLQYAEAIRVFQLRNGRLPLRLEELVIVRPRSIRQLWKDPMTENGEWGLIYAQVDPGRRGQRGRRGSGVAPQQEPQTFGGSAPRPLGGEESRASRRGQTARAVAPIMGVHSLSEEEAIKNFFGGGKHSDWRFTVDLVPVANLSPDSLSPVRANARWVGRPFRPDLAPAQGNTPEESGQGPGTRTKRRRVNRSGGD